MLSKVLSGFPLPWLSCVGLMIFLAVFIGVVVWVNRKGSESLYKEMASAPLNEEMSGVQSS